MSPRYIALSLASITSFVEFIGILVDDAEGFAEPGADLAGQLVDNGNGYLQTSDVLENGIVLECCTCGATAFFTADDIRQENFSDITEILIRKNN